MGEVQRVKLEWRFFILFLIASTILTSGIAESGVLYTLSSGSSFQEGCVGPCMCPVWESQDVTGKFQLVLLGSDPLFTNYRLDAISWTVMGFDGEVGHEIVGGGTYRVGGEVAVTHQLTLDLNIDGGELEHLDSGLVPGGSEFPVISISVSRGTLCFDIQMDINARPEPNQVIFSDLTAQWISLVQSCGETRKGMKCRLSGKVTIQNTGNQSVPSSVLQYYLSEDGQYNERSIFLKEVAIGTIKIGKSKTKTFSYTLPLGETITGKYIIAVISGSNTGTKANESSHFAAFGPIP